MKGLSLSLWLANRFYKGYKHDEDNHKNATGTAVAIATIGVALGLAVMLVSVSVVKGFQKEVSSKFTGIASHIIILNDSSVVSPDSYPVNLDTAFVHSIQNIEHVLHVQHVAQKMGVLKTDDAYQAIILKGVGQDYNYDFLQQHLIEGVIPQFSDSVRTGEVLLSELQSQKMGVGIGDKIYAYFFEDHIKARKLDIVGIYRTYLPQFDNNVAFTDKYTVKQLNGWKQNECSNIEIYLDDLENIDNVQYQLKKIFDAQPDKTAFYSHLSIKENPQTALAFSWLEVLNVNVWAILIIMMGVACFTMISGLLILILERTQTIGILKAMGINNARLQSTFITYAALIVGKGLFWGNIIGLGIVGAQHFFGFITLDPESYYVSVAPVSLDFWWIVGLNIMTLIVTLLSLIIPSLLVYRIEPAKAIQFE